jgi:uncharacterized protein
MTSDYMNRIIDNELRDHLEAMGAVLIVGPKWCGKTTTAMQQAKSVLRMQDPDKTEAYLVTAKTKPSLLLIGDTPRLIDEWQMAPSLWDAVRTAVDDRSQDGQFILTGSTTIDESTIMHSGVGRISRLMMRPMSLFESNESNGKISLKKLLDQPDLNIDGIVSDLSIERLIYAACRGGWPSALNKRSEKAGLLVAQAYVDAICETDVSAVDGIKKDPRRVRALLQSYARNLSTLATNKTIMKDINANFVEIVESTYYVYVNALSRIFVIDDVPAWNPSIRSATVIRSSHKKAFIDPSIAAAALRLTPEVLMQDLHTFGFLFENLITRDLKVYSQSLGSELSYYHDRLGLEADAVLRLPNGTYALIEYKLGSQDIDEAAKHLLELKNLILQYNIEHADSPYKVPSLLMVITGGPIAYTRSDGVKVIPIGTLRD